MQFRRQLVIGHSALLFVTTMIGATAMIAMHVASVRLERVAGDLAADMIAIERLRFQAEQVVATSRGYLLTGDPHTLERFEDAVTRVDSSLATLEHRRADLGDDDITRIDDATRTYVAAARRAAERRTKTDDPRDVVPFFETTLAPARDRFESAVTGFVQREQSVFEQACGQARDFADRTPKIIGATTALAIALGIALAWLSIRKLNAHYAREREATIAARRAADARDEMIAVVSHDLRSPLAAISLGATLLDTTIVDAPARKQLAMIRRASEHMEHLIGELLDVAQLENGTLELQSAPCAVASLFDAVRSLFDARATQGDLELTIDPDQAGSVLGDRDRLVQVLSNLVGNALKFTPPGGRVMLAARCEGGDVRIAVTDTGPGVPAADAPHLFERYWQGRRHGRGSLGLGLYICKKIVDAHHGRIGVETRPGGGSTFWLAIPSASLPHTTS